MIGEDEVPNGFWLLHGRPILGGDALFTVSRAAYMPFSQDDKPAYPYIGGGVVRRGRSFEFDGKTRAEAILRFRVAKPGESLYEMKAGFSVNAAFASPEQLVGRLEEIPE